MMGGVVPAGWPLAATRLLLLFLGASLMWEVSARIGCGFLRCSRTRDGADSLASFGVGLLVGWGVLGFALSGLAFAGLLYPALVMLVPVLLLACSRRGLAGGSLLVQAMRSWRLVGWPGLAALGATLLPLIPHLLVPEVEQDVYAYHLGAPWQFLLTHRVQLDRVFMDFHLPLPVEMTFTIPLAAGFERLARWTILSFAFGISSLWAGMCLKEGKRDAAWLGPLVALSTAHLPWLLTRSKNDVAAAAFIVAGALLQARRAGIMGAILFGLGTCAKPVFGPLAAAWWLFRPPAPRRIPLFALLLVLPISVWWAKAWIATGNPVYPLATGVFPTFDWDARNTDAYASYITPLLPKNTRELANLPAAFLENLGDKSLLLPLVLPGLLLFGGSKRLLWAVLVGGLAILGAGKFARFMLPASWLLCLFASSEAMALAPRWRMAVVTLAAAYSIGHSALNPLIRPIPWLEAGIPFQSALSDKLETFGEAVEQLKQIGPRRVVTQGELRSYRIPARVIFSGYLGQTPLRWKMVRESRTPADLDRKYRQLGNPVVMHNLVGAITKAGRYRVFEWDERMLRLYHSWCRTRLEVAGRPRRSDTGVGCYYFYRFPPRRGPAPPEASYFIPGAETSWAKAIDLRNSADFAGATEEMRRLLGVVPGLGNLQSEMGFVQYMNKDYRGAVATMRGVVSRGVLDTKNYLTYALALSEMGAYDEGDRWLVKSREYYWMSRIPIEVDRGDYFHRRAAADFRRGSTGGAERWARRAVETLEGLSMDGQPGYVSASRRTSLALAYGLLGDLAWAAGRRLEAAGEYRNALALNAGVPGARKWLERTGEPRF